MIALGLAACGGGSDPAEPLVARTVEAPQQLAQVEAYQKPASSVLPMRQLQLPRGHRPEPTRIRLSHLQDPGPPEAAVPGQPMQIGSAREVPATADAPRTRNLLRFQPGAPGEGATAAMSFRSPGAAGLRLGLRVHALPDAARIRGYTQGGATVFELSGADILAAIRRNRDAGDVGPRGRTVWTPVVESDEMTLEIVLPPGADSEAVRVAMPVLSHLTMTARQLDTVLAATAASCEVDVSCSSDVDDPSRATARMIFVRDGASYACTGTLLNDSQSSGTPYLLSANHCIDSQTAASSLVTYWSFRSASCNSRVLSPQAQQVNGGATLLYASTATDTAFMRLNNPAPAAAAFAGWSASLPSTGLDLIGIHHPRGDLQKVSRGILAGFLNCDVPDPNTFSCNGASQATGSYVNARWSSGTVESGSSGSGLFAAIGGTRYLVGQLKGGSASCQSPAGLNAYGRFDVAYATALSRWLSPGAGSPASITAAAASPAVPRVPVHRFYNLATGAHFYTPLAAERDYVLATFPSYAYEGVAFFAYDKPVIGSYPVYRVYNRGNQRHFYTIARDERDALLASSAAVIDEGIGWYAQWGDGGSASPMYRFYNSVSGSHFYTLSEGEKQIVLRDYPSFRLEGIAFRAWSTQ